MSRAISYLPHTMHWPVDQLDDPEFTYKDFEDLIGRLRGTAPHLGDLILKTPPVRTRRRISLRRQSHT